MALVIAGTVLSAVVVAHGGGFDVVLSRLEITLALVFVGAVTAFADRDRRRAPGTTLGWLGAIIIGGVCLNSLPMLLQYGEGALGLIVPFFLPHGNDFRVGLYEPAAAFSSASSAWPPLTLVLGRPFTLLGPGPAYVTQVAILFALAAAAAALSATLATEVSSQPDFNGTAEKAADNVGAVKVSVLLGLWLVTSYGFGFEVERGNVDLYALVFALLSMWLLVRHPGRLWLTAICLALAINIKLYPAVLLAPFLWRHRWRALVPIMVTNAGLLLIAGPGNAASFVGNLGSMQASPFLWVGNHSAASYGSILATVTGIGAKRLEYMLLVLSIGCWALTMVVLVRRDWSPRRAVMAAAAGVPVMCTIPAVSHDYKLVLLVFPLAVLSAVLADGGKVRSRLWSLPFALLGLELVLLSRSTLLVAGPPLIANKFPEILALQLLLLWASLQIGRSPTSIEVDALLLDDERAMVDLRLDRADVLTQDPDEEQLHATQEVDPDDERRKTEVERLPPHHFEYQIG